MKHTCIGVNIMGGSMEVQADTVKVRGVVKWFDPAKGFGFVVSDEGGSDILLHANVLRNFGQSSVADNSVIEMATQHTTRGMQAVEVLSIEPPQGRGSGFANVFGLADDVFVHVEVLRRSGLADLLPGEALALRVIDGRRGRMAVEVAAWEAALH